MIVAMKFASVNGILLVATLEKYHCVRVTYPPAQPIVTSPSGNFAARKIETENLRSPSYLTDRAIPSLIGRDAYKSNISGDFLITEVV